MRWSRGLNELEKGTKRGDKEIPLPRLAFVLEPVCLLL